MKFDASRLTLGEIATIEDLSGQSLTTISDEDRPKGKLLAAMVMIAQRRNGFPGFKFGDALALSFDEANAILGLDDEDDADESGDEIPLDGGEAHDPAAVERPTSARTARPQTAS